jgi:hypothetical protein
MPSKEQLAFLQSSLERWRTQGLIDETTFQRLSADVERDQDRELAAPAAEDVHAAAARTEVAPAPVFSAAAVPPVAAIADALDPALAAEVAFHVQLDAEVTARDRAAAEQRAALDRVPVAERPADLGQALLAAVSDLGSVPAAAPPLAARDAYDARRVNRSIEQRILVHEAETSPPSLWNSALRPFLVANAMWLAGALLIIAGSIYFLRLAWDHLSSVPLHLVVAGALHGYAAAFFAVGYLLSRKQQAHAVGRIMFAFACGILPLGSVAVGELALVAPNAWDAGGAALAVLAVGLSLLVQGFIFAVVAGLYERAALRLTVTTGLGLAFLIMATRLVGAALEPGASLVPGLAVPVVLTPLGLAALAHGFLGLPRHRVHLRMSILLYGGAMLWAFAVLVVRAQILQPISATHHAAFLAALSALLVITDHRLRMRASDAPRLTELNVGFYAASLGALTLALAGLGVHGYFDVWARVNVLACALVATALFGQGAWRHGRSAMTWLAATAGLLAYFFLPAPFTALIQLAQEAITSALGYDEAPLPVAFYGLLFVPYLAGLCALDLRLRARHPGRTDLVRDLEGFVLTLSVALVFLAMLGNGDPRPVLWTWPIYAAAAFLGARALARPWLRLAGHALTLAWLSQAVTWLVPTLSPAPVLALYGLVAAAVLGVVRGSGRDTRHLVFAALAGAAAAALVASVAPALILLALPAAWPTTTTAVLTAVLIALTMGRLAQVERRAWCAHLASLSGLAASVIACVMGHVSQGAALTVLLVHAAAYAAVAHAVRRADGADARWSLLARPALNGAILALLAAWVPAGLEYPYTAPLLISAMLAHLAWLARGAIPMAIAAVSGACAVVLAAEGLDNAGVLPAMWQVALAGLGCVYLVLAGFFPPAWPAALQRRTTLAAVGLIALGLSLSDTLMRAVERGDALSLWWRSAVEMAALTAVGAWLWWRSAFWQRFWAGLWPLAFVVTGQLGAISLAVALSTGRNPPAAVMALMAPVALFSALALDAMARRWRQQRDVALMGETGFVSLMGAGLLAGSAVIGCLPDVPGFVSVLGLLALAAVAAVLVRDGVREGTGPRGHLALVVVTALYVLARLGTGLAVVGHGGDAVVIVVAAEAALWTGLRLRPDARLGVLRVPLQTAALLWPLPSVWLMLELGPTARCILGFVVAVHYAVMGRLLHRRNMAPLALAFGNAALLLTFGALGWVDTLLYAVPLAFSALVLVHVYAGELGQQGRNSARAVILLALYVLALSQALAQATPFQALFVVPLLCVAAIAAGTLLQVRVYVLMGVAFLAADLAANMLRYGLQHRLMGALFLTMLGLAIVAGMVYFSVQRERIMQRYSSIVGRLQGWD